MDKSFSKLSELSSRIASISDDVIAEEKKLSDALSQKLPEENLQSIKDRLIFLKRKYVLYKQAEQMRKKSL